MRSDLREVRRHSAANNHSYHESLGDLTPAEFFGRAHSILRRRKVIKRKTIEKRGLLHRQTAA
jgi:hypothetical protein